MAEDWEHFKDTIHQLWIVNNLPLDAVINRMKNSCGFERRKPQYERKLKAWGFRKNLKKSEQIDIARMAVKRQREGKESEATLDGIKIPSKRIKRVTMRIPWSTVYIEESGSSDTSPITISTPPPEMPIFSWFGKLPWFQFVELHLPIPVCLHTCRGEDISREGDLNYDASSQFISRSETSLSTTLRNIMPEAHDGELDDTASILLSKSTEIESARLRILLYQLSNKMKHSLELQPELTDMNVIRTVKQLAQSHPDWMANLLQSDELTAAAIKENIFNAAMRLLDEGIINQLLAAGVDPNMPITMRLIEVKIPVKRGRETLQIGWSHESHCCTPLQWAISAQKADLVNALTCAGAQINLSLQERDLSPLELACGIAAPSGHPTALSMAKKLVERGAPVNRAVKRDGLTALILAVASGNAQLVDFLIKSGTKVMGRYQFSGTKNIKLNAFQIALLKGDTSILELLRMSPTYSTSVPRGLNLPVMAVGSQHPHKMLPYLRSLGVDITASSKRGEDPMTIALLLGNYHNALTRLRSVKNFHDTRPAPIHAAALIGDTDLIDFLLDQGASINHVLNPNPADVEMLREIYNVYSNYHCNKWESLRTPLQVTLGAGHVQTAMYLITRGSILLGGELVMAARLRSSVLVTNLINHGARLNDVWDGQTAIQAAIERRNRSIAIILIHACSIIIGGEYVQALMKKDQELVDMIATHVPLPILMKPGPEGQSPLEAACFTGNIRVAEYLLSQNMAQYESSALCAATWNYVESWIHPQRRDGMPTSRYVLVETLIKFRKPSVIDEFEATALGIAAKYKDFHLLHLLVYDDFQPGPSLALDSASAGDSIGCWWRKARDTQKSPLHIAAETKDHMIVSLLLAKGYRPDDGCFLYSVELILKSTAADIVRTIWEARPPSDYGTECAGKAFEMAIKHKSIECVRRLLEADLAADSRTPSGWTPLQLSVQYGCMETIKTLVEARAEVNAPPAREAGVTAAQAAAIMGHMGVMRFLMELGADINAATSERSGRTALEGAAEYGRLDMVQLLLGKGVITEGNGRRQFVRAVFMAEREGHYAVACALEGWREWIEEDEALLEIERAYFRSRN